jgi:hypothetical protein
VHPHVGAFLLAVEIVAAVETEREPEHVRDEVCGVVGVGIVETVAADGADVLAEQ